MSAVPGYPWRMVRSLTAWLTALALLTACGDDDDPGPPDAAPDAGLDAGDPAPAMYPEATMPAATTPVPGVRREVFHVAGTTPPPNPVTGGETPAELNVTQVLRYRRDVDPPAEARAILVAMPGFLGGGGSFDGLARALVSAGLADGGGDVEVWAIDRRANLLEDLRGADAAEALGDPEVADGYYFHDATVGGEAFAGFVRQSAVDYMSEWGLATHVEDLHAVIGTVPEAERRRRVFLMGHSLGASFAEAYAAWRFGEGDDATHGFDELAGLILVDGLLGAEPTTETEYREGQSMGGIPQPGLDEIRAETRFFALPLLGVAVYARTEVLGLRALQDPALVVDDSGRDRVLATLSGLAPTRVPPMDNATAMALGFDDAHGPLAFARARLGTLVGPTENYGGLFGGEMLQRPSDPETTYRWTDAPEAGEITSIDDLARAFTHGRSNFAEWYFPVRLPVDLAAVGGAAIAEDGWQASEGLRSFDGAAIDLPILAVACGLIGDPARYDELRARLTTPVGAGRPAAGATRDTDAGLRVVDATDLAHLDPNLSSDRAANPTIEETSTFVGLHAAAGGVTIDALVME